MPSEYIPLSIITFIKVVSLLLIVLKNRYGLPLFFSCLGLSSMNFGYSKLPGGIGTTDTLEWVAELFFLIVAVLILFYRHKTKIFNVKPNYIFNFFLLIGIVYVVSIRSFDLYMLSVLLNALYPVVFYLFINHFLSENRISPAELSKYILISVGVSLFITLALFLLGNEIYYFESMDGFARFRFFGSLGPLTYSYFLLPFAVYFIVTSKWKLFLLIFLLILVTGSRLNSMILFIASSFFFLNRKNLFTKKLVLIGIIISIPIIVILTVNHFMYFNGGRLEFWNVAIVEAFKSIPTLLFGNGTGFAKYINYEIFSLHENFPTIHNQFLKISVDVGILLGLFAFFFYPVYAIKKLSKKNSGRNLFRMYCLISLIVIIVSSTIADSFNPTLYKSFLLVSFLLQNEPVKIISSAG